MIISDIHNSMLHSTAVWGHLPCISSVIFVIATGNEGTQSAFCIRPSICLSSPSHIQKHNTHMSAHAQKQTETHTHTPNNPPSLIKLCSRLPIYYNRTRDWNESAALGGNPLGNWGQTVIYTLSLGSEPLHHSDLNLWQAVEGRRDTNTTVS